MIHVPSSRSIGISISSSSSSRLNICPNVHCTQWAAVSPEGQPTNLWLTNYSNTGSAAAPPGAKHVKRLPRKRIVNQLKLSRNFVNALAKLVEVANFASDRLANAL